MLELFCQNAVPNWLSLLRRLVNAPRRRGGDEAIFREVFSKSLRDTSAEPGA